jgi:hypothetical protein
LIFRVYDIPNRVQHIINTHLTDPMDSDLHIDRITAERESAIARQSVSRNAVFFNTLAKESEESEYPLPFSLKQPVYVTRDSRPSLTELMRSPRNSDDSKVGDIRPSLTELMRSPRNSDDSKVGDIRPSLTELMRSPRSSDDSKVGDIRPSLTELMRSPRSSDDSKVGDIRLSLTELMRCPRNSDSLRDSVSVSSGSQDSRPSISELMERHQIVIDLIEDHRVGNRVYPEDMIPRDSDMTWTIETPNEESLQIAPDGTLDGAPVGE